MMAGRQREEDMLVGSNLHPLPGIQPFIPPVCYRVPQDSPFLISPEHTGALILLWFGK